ncbi:MAG: lipid-A-disaccharide synthase [Planctomycetota bacterium]
MHRLGVFAILCRETLRAAAVPLHLLRYLPRRHKHREEARRLLDRGLVHTERGNLDAREMFRRALGNPDEPPRSLFLACGEPSGERHALALIEALRETMPDLEITAIGGSELESNGVRLLTNLADHAVMGILAVFRRIPFYCGLMARYLAYLDRAKPDLVLLIDNPGLNMLLAEQAKARGIPVLYYICPQYWAWGPWRMQRFRSCVDGAISILPFEPSLFWKAGVPTAYAGHPLLPKAPEPAPEPRDPLLVILPGSRQAEIERHLLPMVALFDKLKQGCPEARAVIVQQNPQRLARIRDLLGEHCNGSLELRGGDPFPVLRHARLALVKSGTSSLQTAMCRTPEVVVFKLGGFSETVFAHNFISVPWIAAPNLVAGRTALPEFCFHSDKHWNEVFAAMRRLWDAGDARTEQLGALDEIRARLAGRGAAAEAVRWICP